MMLWWWWELRNELGLLLLLQLLLREVLLIEVVRWLLLLLLLLLKVLSWLLVRVIRLLRGVLWLLLWNVLSWLLVRVIRLLRSVLGLLREVRLRGRGLCVLRLLWGVLLNDTSLWWVRVGHLLNGRLRIEAGLLSDFDLEVHMFEVVGVVVVVMVMVVVMRILELAKRKANAAAGVVGIDFFKNGVDLRDHLRGESSVPDTQNHAVDEEVDHRDYDEYREVECVLADLRDDATDEKTKKDKKSKQHFGSLWSAAASRHNGSSSRVDIFNCTLELFLIHHGLQVDGVVVCVKWSLVASAVTPQRVSVNHHQRGRRLRNARHNDLLIHKCFITFCRKY